MTSPVSSVNWPAPKAGFWRLPTIRKENIFLKGLGEERAQSILMMINEEGQGSTGSIRKLKELDPQILTDFTKNEHPQTIALILSQLAPEQAAQVLESHSVDMQCEIAKRMATLKSVPSEFIEEIARTLEKEIAVGRVSSLQTGGSLLDGGGSQPHEPVQRKHDHAGPG